LLLKRNYKAIKTKLVNRINKSKNNIAGELPEKREVSKFLKMVSEYKHKIKKIKHQILEEENIR
jgi:RAB protein geranylgeranyltransferase component A